MDDPPQLTIQGCPVAFPFKAYPSQMSMMSRIIQALEKKQNCLLESPTGSGKSLSLLCASLGWLKREIDNRNEKIKAELQRLEADSDVLTNVNEASCCPLCSVGDIDDGACCSSANAPMTECGLDDSIVAIKRSNVEACSAKDNPIVISDDESETTEEPATKKFRFHDEELDEDFVPVKVNRRSHNILRRLLTKGEEMDVKPNGEELEVNSNREEMKGKPEGESEADPIGEEMEATPNEEKKVKPEGMTDFQKSDGATATPSKVACSQCSCHIASIDEIFKKRTPKIFYGTRTHNQIGQVIREMKRTSYKTMKMTVLSSRDHTCINDMINDLPRKNELCRDLLADSACGAYTRVRRADNHEKIREECHLDGAYEIEELVSALKEVGACPYYAARELVATADIVFCPYSYLIDPTFRDAVGLNLGGHIIIFDEAHNIEASSCDAASFDITQEQLESAKHDLKLLIIRGIHPTSHKVLMDLLDNMLSVMDLTKPRLIRQDFDAASLVWSGQEIVALMDTVGIGPAKVMEVVKHFNAVLADTNRDSENATRRRKKKDRVRMESASIGLFESLFLCLKFIFKDEMKHRDDYHVALVQTTSYTRGDGDTTSGYWMSKRRSNSGAFQEKQVLTLSFWCMNPAVAFEEISKNAHSVILTSGTLSPLDSFASELDVEFPLRLEANHVVRPDQTLIGTIGRAPSGGELCGTFQHYDTYRFQDDLGALIVALCKVVPHGVLCFVPSYSIIDKLVQRWEDTGLLDDLRRVKRVTVEPRRTSDMAAVIADYYDGIESVEDAEGGETVTGAFMLAVCRGKMSEGQDFSDNHARLVISVGIPYPNIKIPKITLKRSYNDRRRATASQVLSGSQWYEVQAFRALNQALGRCIRHRHDWGAILMVDARLANRPDRYLPSISKWLRQRVVHFNSFRQLLSGMEDFVGKRKEVMACGEVIPNVR